MTEQEALSLGESKWWEGKSAEEITRFQLFEGRLCMPFGKFQDAVSEALGRPVYTHEFAGAEQLRKEFLGERRAPTFKETLPKDKDTLLVLCPGGDK